MQRSAQEVSHIQEQIQGKHTGSEEAHSSYAQNRLANPFFLILVRLIDEILGLTVAVEVIAHLEPRISFIMQAQGIDCSSVLPR